MAFTVHGHHIPGTTLGTAPLHKARCGGVEICPKCKDDVKDYFVDDGAVKSLDISSDVIPDNRIELVSDALSKYIHKNYGFLTTYSVRIVWFAKVLQNWKALACTNLPDEKYYEITYDGDKKRTYVDEYVKIKNEVFPD